jgi:hypothetical protein
MGAAFSGGQRTRASRSVEFGGHRRRVQWRSVMRTGFAGPHIIHMLSLVICTQNPWIRARVGHGFGSTRRVSRSGRSGKGRGPLGSQTRRNPLPDPRAGGLLRVRIIRLLGTILSLSLTLSRVLRDCREKLDLQFNSS